MELTSGDGEATETPAQVHFDVDIEVEVLDIGATLRTVDSLRAARLMREAGCSALVALGGDGTNRAIASEWSDAPLVSISTGTNNVFPTLLEPTTAGAAAGLVASGELALDEVAGHAVLVDLDLEGHEFRAPLPNPDCFFYNSSKLPLCDLHPILSAA